MVLPVPVEAPAANGGAGAEESQSVLFFKEALTAGPSDGSASAVSTARLACSRARSSEQTLLVAVAAPIKTPGTLALLLLLPRAAAAGPCLLGGGVLLLLLLLLLFKKLGGALPPRRARTASRSACAACSKLLLPLLLPLLLFPTRATPPTPGGVCVPPVVPATHGGGLGPKSRSARSRSCTSRKPATTAARWASLPPLP